MANDPQERQEEAALTVVQEAIYALPEWVVAELPTEEELGVEDDKPVPSTRHRKQSDLLLHLLDSIFAGESE